MCDYVEFLNLRNKYLRINQSEGKSTQAKNRSIALAIKK